MAEPSQNEEDIFEAVHHAEASSIQEGFQSGMLYVMYSVSCGLAH